MKIFKSKSVYLDYASSSPVDKRVLSSMKKVENLFSNPNSIHEKGVEVRNQIEKARENIAKLINAHKDEIFFTGSGTESDALAILGVVYKAKKEMGENFIPHIVTTSIEHPAVLENCKYLESRGYAKVTYVSPDKGGLINPKDVKETLTEDTVLVSVMYANNEIGTIEPIQEIAKEIRHFRKIKKEKMREKALPLENPRQGLEEHFPLFHTDACQAMNYLFTSNIEKLGVDMMSFNGAKIYGPKGIGVLYKKRDIEIEPVYAGGGQEGGLRSGTESVSLIVGISKALSITEDIKVKESERLTILRDYLIDKLLHLREQTGFKMILNGDKEARLPNNVNISILGISSELVVVELSAKGIYVSEKSACHSDDANMSYVIKAIRKTCSKNEEEGSIRISLGRDTKKKDLDYLISSLTQILNKYKKWK